jgi:regulator of protease activity HflC (stomatin/prohibitin superfamily)
LDQPLLESYIQVKLFISHLVISYIILIPFVLLNLKTVQQYERGVLFRFGRLIEKKLPGLHILLPMIVRQLIKQKDELTIVDMRVITLDVPEQEVITKDSV